MPKYHVVTTMRKDGWEHYGERCMDSFVARWPSSIGLTIYAEGFTPPMPFEYIDINGIRWLSDFKAAHPDHKYDDRPEPIALWKVSRWAHAVAATLDACASQRGDVIIRLDADVFTHTNVTEEWLDSLFPQGYALGLLKRVGPGKYPEMGFSMFRLGHPETQGILRKWLDLYTSGKIFELPGWTDAHALMEAVRLNGRTLTSVCSLSGAAKHSAHPFINGPLGARMDHMKGARRKRDGRSNSKADLLAPRQEAYWND